MSTPTAAIWSDAISDAIGKANSKAAPLTGHPSGTDAIWGDAVKDALGIKTAGTQNTTPEPEQGFWRGSPSIPGQAIQEASTMTPGKMKEGAVTAGKTAVAGAVAGSAALRGAALLAPSAGTATVGTGILGPAGEELTRDIATQGPSLARAGFNMAVQAIKAHPYISGAIGLRLSKALGLPVDKVVKALLGMSIEAAE